MDFYEFEALMAKRSHISRKYRVEIFLATTFLAGLALHKIGKRGLAEKIGFKDETLSLTAEQQMAIANGKRVVYQTPVGPMILERYDG